MVNLRALPSPPPTFEILSSNFSCPCDTSVREPQRALTWSRLPFAPVSSQESHGCCANWKLTRRLRTGLSTIHPRLRKEGQECSELLHSINSWAPRSLRWAHLTQSACRCWAFRPWIEGAARLSADFQPAKLGLWSQRTASNTNQFPLYSKESS